MLKLMGKKIFTISRQIFLSKPVLVGTATAPVANCKEKEFSSHPKQDMTLKDYLDYWEDYRDRGYPETDPCLYLKDWHFTM